MYKLEEQIIKDFQDNILNEFNPFDIINFANEFYYINGKIDIIGITKSKELIAFEAKLYKWRGALNQAYRNSSFSHYSYVLIPESISKNALKNKIEFERRGIGLCSIFDSKINIEIVARKNIPFQPWLTDLAFGYISRE